MIRLSEVLQEVVYCHTATRRADAPTAAQRHVVPRRDAAAGLGVVKGAGVPIENCRRTPPCRAPPLLSTVWTFT